LHLAGLPQPLNSVLWQRISHRSSWPTGLQPCQGTGLHGGHQADLAACWGGACEGCWGLDVHLSGKMRARNREIVRSARDRLGKLKPW